MDVPDYMGFKTFIEKMNDFVFETIESNFSNKSDEIIYSYSTKINDYILRKLYNILWHEDRVQNPTDVMYQSRVNRFDWISAQHVELPEAE